jgi:acyl carrier protein
MPGAREPADLPGFAVIQRRARPQELRHGTRLHTPVPTLPLPYPQINYSKRNIALARKVADGELDLGSAMNASGQATTAPDRTRLEQALSDLGAEPTLVDLTPGSSLSLLAARLLPHARTVTPDASIDEVLAVLYCQGRVIDWRSGIGESFSRMELPAALLAQESCWPPVRARASAVSSPPDDHFAQPGGPGNEESIEEAVLRITRDLLKEKVTLSDDFFDYGGDSLNGALLIERLNLRFGAQLTVLDLFDLPDLGALAAAIAAGVPAVTSTPPIMPVTRGTRGVEASVEERLSGQQIALWTAVALDPDSDAYNVPAAFLIDGEFDQQRLETALSALVARHDMLRCVLRDLDDGPCQRVAAPQPGAAVLRHLDLDFGDRRSGDAWPDLLTRLQDMISEPFRPYDEHSCRFHLVRARFREGDQHVLVLNFHHLFFDGWSWNIVMDELAAPLPAEQAPRSYLSHVREQEESLCGDRGRLLHEFWTEYLRGALRAQPPADQPGLGPMSAGADLELDLGTSRAAALRSICRAERASLNMLFTAAWTLLQWQLSGQSDICVAMPIANGCSSSEWTSDLEFCLISG